MLEYLNEFSFVFNYSAGLGVEPRASHILNRTVPLTYILGPSMGLQCKLSVLMRDSTHAEYRCAEDGGRLVWCGDGPRRVVGDQKLGAARHGPLLELPNLILWTSSPEPWENGFLPFFQEWLRGDLFQQPQGTNLCPHLSLLRLLRGQLYLFREALSTGKGDEKLLWAFKIKIKN